MEEYRSLYRKYRPQAPNEVLGQEPVIRALAGAVGEGRLAHAFLFSGPRGTGKTSTARILAKMVNCEKGPTAEPCGVCEQCIRIRDGSHLDVVEIDAASHGGVDDARELRERAPTAPAQGREKVYIIDEAQRLSREAFDALLKVFEEPPPGVRFVLATTEPHKMPATIVGRCQRFEFRRVPAEEVAAHLETVAKDESIALRPEAAAVIARETEGSVRDALSLLDQAAVLGGGEVDEEVVASLIGTPDLDVLFEVADAIAVGDARAVFGVIHRLVQEGHDLRHFAGAVTGHFRNLLLAQASPEDPEIVDVPADAHARLLAQGQKLSPGELDRTLSLLLQAQADMRWSTAPRLTLELALVRAAMPETDTRPEALLSRIERLERLSGIDSHTTSRASTGPPEGRSGLIPSSGPADEPPSTSKAPAEPSEGRSGLIPSSGPADAKDEPDPEVGGASVPQTERTAAGPETGIKPDRPVEGPAAGPQGPEGVDDGSSGQEGAVGGAKVEGPAGKVDAQMLRRAWPQVVDTLKARRKMVLYANAEIATVGGFDGRTLELVFPPDRPFGAAKVQDKQGELQEILQEMFGISPAIRCTVREGGGSPEPVEEEPPSSPEAAEELLRTQFGAEVLDEPEGE